jgi:mono/diheme cytochrome c family protein
MRYAYTLALLLAGTLVALPNPPVCHQPAHVANKVVVANAAIVPAVLPLYGAGYVGAASTDDETKELLRRIAEGQEKILKALENLGGGTVGIQEDKGPDVFALVKAKCASCHSGEKAKGGFQMLNDAGEFLRLSGPDRRSVLARIEGKGGAVMPPPPGKLTPAELQALKAALVDKPSVIPAGKK